jgi:hypothetical protein
MHGNWVARLTKTEAREVLIPIDHPGAFSWPSFPRPTRRRSPTRCPAIRLHGTQERRPGSARSGTRQGAWVTVLLLTSCRVAAAVRLLPLLRPPGPRPGTNKSTPPVRTPSPPDKAPAASLGGGGSSSRGSSGRARLGLGGGLGVGLGPGRRVPRPNLPAGSARRPGPRLRARHLLLLELARQHGPGEGKEGSVRGEARCRGKRAVRVGRRMKAVSSSLPLQWKTVFLSFR